MKFISYICTVGGDTGWRFSNGPEWHSAEGQLLFDAEKWDMDSIAAAISELWHGYWTDRDTPYKSHTLGGIMDCGFKYIDPFINDTDGVYVNVDFINSDGFNNNLFGHCNKDKHIHPESHEIIPWTSKNGYHRNFDYKIEL